MESLWADYRVLEILFWNSSLFPPEMVNGGSHDYCLDLCPTCGHGPHRTTTAAPRVVQQIEIHEVPLGIEEHCSRAGWCPHCQKVRYAPLPVSIERGGLVGPRLTTLIAYLKGACHASFSTIRKFLRDVVRVTISRGQFAKIMTKVSEALVSLARSNARNLGRMLGVPSPHFLIRPGPFERV